MRIHHLNCGCMCPLGGALYDGVSKGLSAHLVCHCLLLETEQGLVLVDTGFGTRDIAAPRERLSAFFILLNRIQFERKYTALHQIETLGYRASDVRHIILTHLDFDHAGGLEDFPDATVHVMQSEYEAAQQRHGFIRTRRYRPRQWDEVRHWQFYPSSGTSWFGFDAVRDLKGLPPEILMIPLRGHTEGHAGVAIRNGDHWLLNAGDAYFYRGEIGQRERRCTPGLRFYQMMMEADRRARLRNQERLRLLSVEQPQEVRFFCSHDSVEYDAYAGYGTQAASHTQAQPHQLHTA